MARADPKEAATREGGNTLLAAQVVVRVVQHARHRQPEVGAEHVHKDRVPRVDGSDEVAAEDLVDDKDDLEEAENAPAPNPEGAAEPGDGNNPSMGNDEETAAAVQIILGGEEEEVNQVFVVNVPRYEVGTSADVLAMFKSKQEAILDTGCSKSCASEDWSEAYLASLDEKERKNVVRKISTNSFRFGDNKVYKSMGYIEAPIWIGGKRRRIGWDVLPHATVPLLVSLRVMKRLEMDMKLMEGDYSLATVEGVSFRIENREEHLWLDMNNLATPRELA